MMCILLNKYVDCCFYMPEQQILNVNNFLNFHLLIDILSSVQ